MKQRNWAVVPGVLLAACLQVGIAQAQSSVAVYGRIDLGVRHGPMDLSKSEDSVSYMDDSSRARLGFTGKEDLGNGNSAFFQLEHRFNGTTGAQDGPVYWKDKAWVGLAQRAVLWTAPTPMPCRIVPSASARTPVAPGRIFVVMGALLKSNPADTKAEGKRRRR